MLKLWMQRALLLFAGFLASLFLAEIALRIWTPASLEYKSVRQSDPVLHHKFNPSSHCVYRTAEFDVEVRVNSMGLRDREYEPSEIDSAYRIVVLGDSFTEGIGVPMESTCAKRLETGLNALHPERRCVVFNFGIAGYSPILEYLQLKQKGISLHPHLVILSYDMTDVQEDFLYGEDAEFTAEGIPVKVHPSLPDFGRKSCFPRGVLKTYLQENLFTYSLFATFIAQTRPPLPFERGNIRSSRFVHTVDSVEGPWHEHFARSQSYVKLISDLCSREGAQFLLVVFPRGHQVNSREWIEGRKAWGLDSAVISSAIFKSLAMFAGREGIQYLDMTQTFRDRSHGDLYFPVDGHWTAAGHKVAADTLLSFLIGSSWLKKPWPAAVLK